MKEPYAAGRGLKEPITRLEIESGRVLVRVDDGANPEFWVEVKFPVELLRSLLAAADATGDSEVME